MDGVVANEVTFQLICVQGLDVSSMVLVEVGEAVVEENRRLHCVGNTECDGTLNGGNGGSEMCSVEVCGVDIPSTPSRRCLLWHARIILKMHLN